MFGLTTKSKLEEAREEKEEAEERFGREAEQRHRVENGMKAAIDTLPELPDKKDKVYETDETHVCYKAVREGIAVLLVRSNRTVVYPKRKVAFEDYTKGRKLRVAEAVVLAVKSYNDNPRFLNSGTSKRDFTFKYEVGETVTPEYPLNTNTAAECTHGIHVWRTEKEAISWYYQHM